MSKDNSIKLIMIEKGKTNDWNSQWQLTLKYANKCVLC